jgi:hypothetical protein
LTNVSNLNDFIPVHYTGDAIMDKGQVVRITPFKRNVLLTLHEAHEADFEEIKWILQYGSSQTWYEKPGRAALKQLVRRAECSEEPVDLIELSMPRLVSLETPRVWAAAALTTPTDDDIYDCTADHSVESGMGACYACTNEKSDAIDTTPLVYYIALSTCQASDFYIHNANFNGKHIFKLVKCGSREAAAAEAFYASGANGWNIVFSCVMRLGETFDERSGPVERVDELWKLAEDAEDDTTIRVFY